MIFRALWLGIPFGTAFTGIRTPGPPAGILLAHVDALDDVDGSDTEAAALGLGDYENEAGDEVQEGRGSKQVGASGPDLVNRGTVGAHVEYVVRPVLLEYTKPRGLAVEYTKVVALKVCIV